MFADRGIPDQWWFAPSRVVELVVPGLLDPPSAIPNPVYAELFAAARPVPWVPSHYLGCVAVLLAVLGALDRRGRGPLLLAVAAAWLATGPALGASRLGSVVPIWRSFQIPEKLMGWTALGAAMLVAVGLDRLRSAGPARRRLALAAGGAVVLVVAVALLSGVLATAIARESASTLGENLRHGGVHAALALALAAALLAVPERWAGAAAFALAALVAGDLLAASSFKPTLLPRSALDAGGPLAEWIHARDPLARVSTPFLHGEGESPSREQLTTLGSRALMPLWNMNARVGNMGWYGGLTSGRYRLLREVGDEGFRYLEAAATHGAGYLVVPGVLDNLSRVGIAPASAQPVAFDPRIPATLVQVPHRPFAYLASHVESASAEQALDAVLSPGFATSGRTLVEHGAPIHPCLEPGTVAAGCPTPTRCSLRVTAACDGLLVVNLRPSPGWTLTLDGLEQEPITANFLATAVLVPAGAHELRLAYATPGLFEGALVAMLGALAAMTAARRERRRPSPGGLD